MIEFSFGDIKKYKIYILGNIFIMDTSSKNLFIVDIYNATMEFVNGKYQK